MSVVEPTPVPSRHDGRLVLAASILSAVFTILGVVATDVQNWSRAGFEKLVLIVLAACGLALFAVWLQSLVAGWRLDQTEIIKRRELSVNERAVLQAFRATVPTRVRFVSRHDTFIASSDGSGTVIWDLDLVSDEDENVSTMKLPVLVQRTLAEDSKPGSGSFMAVDEVRVDGLPLDPGNLYTARRHDGPRIHDSVGSTLVEEGELTIPIPLGMGQTRCHLYVRWHPVPFFSGDPNRSQFYLVDIPYVTEELLVEIRGDDSCSIKSSIHSPGLPLQPPIKAVCALLHWEDYDEGVAQRERTSFGQKSIRWHTNTAKIGYRYEVNFEITPVAMGSEGVSSGG